MKGDSLIKLRLPRTLGKCSSASDLTSEFLAPFPSPSACRPFPESCQKFTHAGCRAGRAPQPPFLPPRHRPNRWLPYLGKRSRQAPAAVARAGWLAGGRAQTRRACFRGFNPQVRGQRSAVAEPQQVSRTSPPRPGPVTPRTARPRVGASPVRPPSPTGSALRRRGPQPQPNGLPDAGSRFTPGGSHLRNPPLPSEGRRIPQPGRLSCEAPARSHTRLAVGRGSRGRRSADCCGRGVLGGRGGVSRQ